MHRHAARAGREGWGGEMIAGEQFFHHPKRFAWR